MVAIEHHHMVSPRARWKALYRAQRSLRHRHDGRAHAWQLGLLLLAAFWIAVGYGVYVLT